MERVSIRKKRPNPLRSLETARIKCDSVVMGRHGSSKVVIFPPCRVGGAEKSFSLVQERLPSDLQLAEADFRSAKAEALAKEGGIGIVNVIAYDRNIVK